MNKLVINNTFAAGYTDGFHVMRRNELKRFYGCDENRCGIYDEESHVAIMVTWIKPRLLGFLTDERSILNGAKTQMKRNLMNYCKVDAMKRMIAGCEAVGDRFEYIVDGTDIMQYGDLYVFKFNKTYYAIQLIARKNRFEESQNKIEEFLQSMAAA